MTKLLWIGIGGGLGAVLRHVIGTMCLMLVVGSFLASTMVVDVSGRLLFGLLAAVFAGPYALREELRGVSLIGLVGGYTTYSTFAWQTVNLAEESECGRACTNRLPTSVLGIAGIRAGYRLGTRWFPA